MPLVTTTKMFQDAYKGGYAVGAFNVNNMEMIQAIVEAANECKSPVILQVSAGARKYANPVYLKHLVEAAVETTNIPVAMHLDHGADFEICKASIDGGFTSVMIDYSTLPYEENVKGTKKVADYAHAYGVDVEAELGALPQREGGGESAANPEELYTKPELVKDYIARTGVDALAIAFGTAHGIYKIKPVLNMDIITQVRKLTDLPLVMHGGSGISHEEYREVIRRGISKINYYSYMAYEGYAAAKATIEEKSADFYHNLALNAQKAMYENALQTLKVFSEKE